MSKRKRPSTGQERWIELSDEVRRLTPHLFAFLVDEESFREIRVKAQLDGSFLAIAKGYDGAGGEKICFGAGYGVLGAFLAIDATIQGNRWREDVPYEKRGKR